SLRALSLRGDPRPERSPHERDQRPRIPNADERLRPNSAARFYGTAPAAGRSHSPRAIVRTVPEPTSAMATKEPSRGWTPDERFRVNSQEPRTGGSAWLECRQSRGLHWRRWSVRPHGGRGLELETRPITTA